MFHDRDHTVLEFYPDGGKYSFAYISMDGDVITIPVVGWTTRNDGRLDPLVLGRYHATPSMTMDGDAAPIPLGLVENGQDPNAAFADAIADIERAQLDDEKLEEDESVVA